MHNTCILTKYDSRQIVATMAPNTPGVKHHELNPSVQGALAGSAVLGLGALAYYGAGMSGEMGAIDK